jgi:hypothetical protein
MDTTSTFLLAISSGLGASVVASIVTARTAIGDRKTRLLIAKEDRESAQRRTACVNLEAQRIHQLRVATRLLDYFSTSDPKNLIDTADIDLGNISEATVSLLMSDTVLSELATLNLLFSEVVFNVRNHEEEKRDMDARKASRARADQNFVELKIQSQKWRGLLREEMETVPRSSAEDYSERQTREIRFLKFGFVQRPLTYLLLLFAPFYSFACYREFETGQAKGFALVASITTGFAIAFPLCQKVFIWRGRPISAQEQTAIIKRAVTCEIVLAIGTGLWVGLVARIKASPDSAGLSGLQAFITVVVAVFMFEGLDDIRVGLPRLRPPATQLDDDPRE